MLCLGPYAERGEKLAEHAELTHSDAGVVLLAPARSTPPTPNQHILGG